MSDESIIGVSQGGTRIELSEASWFRRLVPKEDVKKVESKLEIQSSFFGSLTLFLIPSIDCSR